MDRNTDGGSEKSATRQAESCCGVPENWCCTCVSDTEYVCEYEFPKPSRTERLNAWFDRMSLSYKIAAFISFQTACIHGFFVLVRWFTQ